MHYQICTNGNCNITIAETPISKKYRYKNIPGKYTDFHIARDVALHTIGKGSITNAIVAKCYDDNAKPNTSLSGGHNWELVWPILPVNY